MLPMAARGAEAAAVGGDASYSGDVVRGYATRVAAVPQGTSSPALHRSAANATVKAAYG
jgi:hypothetical protein